jgi:branched-chain amino acid transport system ATP-binding protein
MLVKQNAAMALPVAHRAYALETRTVAHSGSAAELQEHPEVRRAYLGKGA